MGDSKARGKEKSVWVFFCISKRGRGKCRLWGPAQAGPFHSSGTGGAPSASAVRRFWLQLQEQKLPPLQQETAGSWVPAASVGIWAPRCLQRAVTGAAAAEQQQKLNRAPQHSDPGLWVTPLPLLLLQPDRW